MEKIEPTEQHKWLMRLLGEWTFQSECPGGPEGENMISEGKEVVRALGDLWVVGEMTSTMPDGSPMVALMTIGYDPATGRFPGTWVGSPMTCMFVYDGELEGNTLTLHTTGPSFADPTKQAKYQDVVELVGDDRRLLRSRCLGEDGEWVEFMKGEFLRVK